MSVHVMKEGFIGIAGEAGKTEETESVTSFEEWNQTAGAWPLKRLVAIWNDLPGVTPVQKFTSREIALQRIWRFMYAPEQTTAAERERAEQAAVSGRLESGPGVYPAVPSGRSNLIPQPSHSRPLRALERRAGQHPARSSSLPFTRTPPRGAWRELSERQEVDPASGAM